MNTNCDKDPKKKCPQKEGIRITGAGVVECRSDAYLSCCKCQEQLKMASQLISNRT